MDEDDPTEVDITEAKEEEVVIADKGRSKNKPMNVAAVSIQ